MKFEIAHDFRASEADLAAALLDEEFQRSVDDIGRLKARSLLSQRTLPDGKVERRTRCVLDVRPTGVARNFLGRTEPAWIEQATWHPSAMRWDWTVIPEVAKEFLDASGSTHVDPNGGGSRRRVEGTIEVKVPFYGSRVEDLIRKGLVQAYDQEAELLEKWLS